MNKEEDFEDELDKIPVHVILKDEFKEEPQDELLTENDESVIQVTPVFPENPNRMRKPKSLKNTRHVDIKETKPLEVVDLCSVPDDEIIEISPSEPPPFEILNNPTQPVILQADGFQLIPIIAIENNEILIPQIETLQQSNDNQPVLNYPQVNNETFYPAEMEIYANRQVLNGINMNNNSFQCNICLGLFPTAASLDEHRHDTHLECRICGKVFAFKNLFEKHVRKHSECKEFSCLNCFKTFESELQLTRHLSFYENRRMIANIKRRYQNTNQVIELDT